ncbi:unnamed protein product [Acanthocheilonema viteae]|uniref:Uncharacterized protein n=1 Tax=Acanthocheilonema viteae TaxID=6277 RepID=A0A498SJL6_ACAVI|nr:unnamed protein product [Acanthocheilonema viteae]
MFSLTLLLSTICAVVVAKEVIQKDIGQGVAVSNTRAHRFNQQNQLQSPTNNQLQYYNTDNQSVRNNIDDRSVWDDSDNQSIWDDSDNHSIWDNSDIYWNSNNSLLIDQLQNKLWNHKNNDSDQPWNRESNNNNRHSKRTCCDHSDITYNRSYEIYNNEQYNSPNNEEKQTTGVGQGRTTETYTYQAAEPSSSPPLNQTNDATRRQTNAMLRFVDFCTT